MIFLQLAASCILAKVKVMVRIDPRVLIYCIFHDMHARILTATIMQFGVHLFVCTLAHCVYWKLNDCAYIHSFFFM